MMAGLLWWPPLAPLYLDYYTYTSATQVFSDALGLIKRLKKEIETIWEAKVRVFALEKQRGMLVSKMN